MYVIVSPVVIDKLQKYYFPADKYGNVDFEVYYRTEEGKEFCNINPLIIEDYSDKKEVSSQLYLDIAWLSLCYNCTLYIYVATDSWYHKNLRFKNLKSIRHLGKCSKMADLLFLKEQGLDSEEVNVLKVSRDSTYYKGDINKIEKDLNRIILNKDFNLREKPIWCVKLTAEDGFVLEDGI